MCRWDACRGGRKGVSWRVGGKGGSAGRTMELATEKCPLAVRLLARCGVAVRAVKDPLQHGLLRDSSALISNAEQWGGYLMR